MGAIATVNGIEGLRELQGQKVGPSEWREVTQEMINTFAELSGPSAFGHAGAGGSLGLADRDRGLGFGYVMNKMNLGLSDDPRALNLVEAAKTCL